jgi:hypothetical protein
VRVCAQVNGSSGERHVYQSSLLCWFFTIMLAHVLVPAFKHNPLFLMTQKQLYQVYAATAALCYSHTLLHGHKHTAHQGLGIPPRDPTFTAQTCCATVEV